jgi:hypothetical protein
MRYIKHFFFYEVSLVREDVKEIIKTDVFWTLNLTTVVTVIPAFRDTLERAKCNYVSPARQYCNFRVKIRKLLVRRLLRRKIV